MKRRITRILSMVLVVGLIAAIPASTQIMDGATEAAGGDSDLPMLVLVNRLELSEEQMVALNDILSDLINEKEDIAGAIAEFENEMIEFNGTEDELDALLATFREEQQASVAALRESAEASLDEVRDLLSINQGLVLQENLPQLLGRAGTGNMGSPRLMNQRSAVRGQMQEESSEACSGDYGNDARASRMQGQIGSRMGGKSADEEMMGQRFGQMSDGETANTLREQVQERVQQRAEEMADQMPEGFAERMSERFGTQMERGSMADQVGGWSAGQGRMGRSEGSSQMIQRMRSAQNERGNLFDVLEQISDVLEMKLEAID